MMRVSTSEGRFRAKAIAGTRAGMIALDCDDSARKGLLGFAFRRQRVGTDPEPKWLRSLKVFESVVPNPDPDKGDYRTNEFPIQSFLWSDFTAEPGTTYQFEIFSAFGKPGELKLGESLKLKVTTEDENDGQHGIWFNRGAIASQAYARQFQNHKPTDKEMSNPKDKHTKWLSRGLLEACLEYINTTKRSEALRACLYEFTYAPVIEAFKKKVDEGFDVKLIVHQDKKGNNLKAINGAGLDLERDGERIVIWRTRAPPHSAQQVHHQARWRQAAAGMDWLDQHHAFRLSRPIQCRPFDQRRRRRRAVSQILDRPQRQPDRGARESGGGQDLALPARAGDGKLEDLRIFAARDGFDAELVCRSDERRHIIDHVHRGIHGCERLHGAARPRPRLPPLRPEGKAGDTGRAEGARGRPRPRDLLRRGARRSIPSGERQDRPDAQGQDVPARSLVPQGGAHA